MSAVTICKSLSADCSYQESGIYVEFRWRRGVVVSGVRRMNEVNAHRTRLVLEWMTVFGQVYHLGM